MYGDFQSHVAAQLEAIRAAGTFKRERVIVSPQDARIRVADGKSVLNMCANNYLGLAEHPEVVAAAHAALDRWGYGLASCGSSVGRRNCTSSLSTGSCPRSRGTGSAKPQAACAVPESHR